MATKRVSSSPGSHGFLERSFSGPSARHEKRIRKYFTARGKPDNYQYTPEEGREAMNYIKAVDRMASGDSWGSGSSFLQGASSYDDMYKYKDPILGMEPDSVTLEDDEIDRLSDLKLADSEELGGDLSDIGNRGESIDETPRALDSEDIADWEEDSLSELRDKIDKRNLLLASSEMGEDPSLFDPGYKSESSSLSLLDYDPDDEAFDHAPESDGGFASSFSSGSDGKLSPMQKYGAKLITDIFSEKEERPQQSIGASPLTPGRSLDMSKYSTSRPKRERYRNMGLLGRA